MYETNPLYVLRHGEVLIPHVIGTKRSSRPAEKTRNMFSFVLSDLLIHQLYNETPPLSLLLSLSFLQALQLPCYADLRRQMTGSDPVGENVATVC